jgi:hypothetical protein
MKNNKLQDFIIKERKRIEEDIRKIDELFEEDNKRWDFNLRPLNVLLLVKKKKTLDETFVDIFLHQRSWDNAQLDMLDKIEKQIKGGSK